MNGIGGFFELELNKGNDLHHNDALMFNSGSSALAFFLDENDFETIYIPYYTCDTVINTVKNSNTKYRFYNIDSFLKPILDFTNLDENDLLIYNDYFGVNKYNVVNVLKKFNNVLIDAAQSFFYKSNEHDYFNSTRKFFGVPDGGFLFSSQIDKSLKKYNQLNKTNYETKHLISRLENGPQMSYNYYRENEELIETNSVGKMSKLTERILMNVDFGEVIYKRNLNFQALNEDLESYNEFNFPDSLKDIVPLCYPFLHENGQEIKNYLIRKNIYVPTYWPRLEEFFGKELLFEKELINNLVCLPIDQRYSDIEMNLIIDEVLKLIK
ncbi:MAG: hypothetical protein ACTH3E_11260 [Psychroflexus halocasei]